MTKEKQEEMEIHQLWMKGYDQLFTARHHGTDLPHYFIQFRENGLDDETIAAAFSVPVDDVDHDIKIYTEATEIMKKSNKLAEAWISKNGHSPLLEGYDE